LDLAAAGAAAGRVGLSSHTVISKVFGEVKEKSGVFTWQGNTLPYNVDRPGGGHDWEFLEAPATNIVVENPENLHAHLLHGLTVPVHTNPEADVKPYRYAAAIDCALAKKLDTD